MYRANLSLLLFVVDVLDDSENSDAKQSEPAQPWIGTNLHQLMPNTARKMSGEWDARQQTTI